MRLEKLIQFMAKRGTLSALDEKRLESIFEKREVSKNELLLRAGEVCSEVYFVNRGLLRCFNFTENGTEFTRLLILENTFGSNLQSFSNRIPSLENIQALEDSEVMVIKHKDFVEFSNAYPNIMSIYRKILEEFQTFHIKRFEFLTNYNSKQRVEKFLIENPELAERVMDRVVASYLNMTPETYSRLKKNFKNA